MNKNRNTELLVECRVCHKTHIVMVAYTDYLELMSPNRRHIQEIFPYLDADERELLISQVCPECWKKVFACLD